MASLIASTVRNDIADVGSNLTRVGESPAYTPLTPSFEITFRRHSTMELYWTGLPPVPWTCMRRHDIINGNPTIHADILAIDPKGIVTRGEAVRGLSGDLPYVAY